MHTYPIFDSSTKTFPVTGDSFRIRAGITVQFGCWVEIEICDVTDIVAVVSGPNVTIKGTASDWNYKVTKADYSS